nr:hypothetical protein [Micromonospora sp. DSM 115978]
KLGGRVGRRTVSEVVANNRRVRPLDVSDGSTRLGGARRPMAGAPPTSSETLTTGDLSWVTDATGLV